MKIVNYLFSLALLLTATTTLANSVIRPCQPKAIYYGKHTASRMRIYHKPALKTAYFHQGLLSNNIKRLARRFGWQMIWNSPYDYNWVSNTKIRSRTFRNFLRKALANYPLQAVLYRGNKILVIQPRTIK